MIDAGMQAAGSAADAGARQDAGEPAADGGKGENCRGHHRDRQFWCRAGDTTGCTIARMNVKTTAALAFIAALVACGSDQAQGSAVEGLVQFARMYSAYDGVHEYEILVQLNPVDAEADDPIALDSVRWTVDESFVASREVTDPPGAMLLTTRRAGTTRVGLAATRRSGASVRGEASVAISEASADEWNIGDARYNRAKMLDGVMPPLPPPEMEGPCGLRARAAEAIPFDTACHNCHDPQSPVSRVFSPRRTAAYTDDELIGIFARGELPPDGLDESAFLSQVAMPECLFTLMHQADDIDEPTARGLVWKLRSLEP